MCVSGGGLGMHENSAPLFWLNLSSALYIFTKHVESHVRIPITL